MGLDMYLNRYPKLGLPVRTMDNIEAMWHWKEKGKDKEFTLEEWCDVKESELPVKAVLDLCELYRHLTYAAWDVEKRYPSYDMHDQVGYWRKANAIHGWFERNVADGQLENCEYYLVSKEHLESLRDTCKHVLDNSKLVAGKVVNGYSLENGKWSPNYEDGLVIEDATACEEFLPTQDGFFFGSTEYNEWYLDDVKHTYELCEKLLKETDFEQYELFYCASW